MLSPRGAGAQPEGRLCLAREDARAARASNPPTPSSRGLYRPAPPRHPPLFPALCSYADVIVHRVLMAALGLRPLPDSLRDRELMHGVVDNLNVRHRWVGRAVECVMVPKVAVDATLIAVGLSDPSCQPWSCLGGGQF